MASGKDKTTNMAAPLDTPAEEMPYDTKIYHSVTLPLYAACKEFERRNAQSVINTVVRCCFLKHHVEDTFSACLIHRHFDLAHNERNVEQGGKARASADLDGIYASSWMYAGGKLYPWEYKRYPVAKPPAAFAEEYGSILQAHGLDDLIGFQVYTDGVVGFETTDPDTHVSTTIDKSERDTVPSGWSAASWAFFRCVPPR